jgi:hypothetical protein
LVHYDFVCISLLQVDFLFVGTHGIHFFLCTMEHKFL